MRSGNNVSPTMTGAPRRDDTSACTSSSREAVTGHPSRARAGDGRPDRRAVGLAATVSFRAMPPLETPMSVKSDRDLVHVRHGEAVVGEGRPHTLTVDTARTVSWEEALTAAPPTSPRSRPHTRSNLLRLRSGPQPRQRAAMFAGPVPRPISSPPLGT